MSHAAAIKADVAPAVPLRPEIETKITEFLKKAGEAKRRLWESEIKKQIAKVSEVTEAHPEQPALEKAAKEAVELSLKDWTAKAGEGWREWARQTPDAAPEMFDQMLAQIDQAAQSDWFGEYMRPFEQPQWTAGLRAALTAEQLATWEKAEEKRRQDVQKELGGTLPAAVERHKTQLRTSFEKKGAAIASALKLPPERARKLDALAESIATASAEKWRVRAERVLLAMDDGPRRDLLKRGHFYLRPEPDETKRVEAEWEAGVAKLLTADEAVRLRTTQSEFKERRTLALARVVVAQFDELVAFTAEQRERLQSIAERLVRASAPLIPESDEGYFQISTQNLLGLGRGVKEDELSAILDATQRARWTDAGTSRSTSRSLRLAIAPAPVAAPAPTAQPSEPEDLEHAISDHLHEQTATERKRLLAAHLLKAEDAARVAKLDEAVVARLKTAARGSAEEELAVWKASTDQNVRGQLRDVTLEGLKQRLAGLDRFGIVRRTSTSTELGGLWDATVKAELTDAQRAAWKRELDARAAYRDAAIAALVMAEFDRRVALTSEQYEKLSPRVAAMLKQYAPDIASMFSYSSGYTWYLASHSMFLPIAAVPEAEMKALLTKEQWERWTGTQEFGNLANYWENIQRIHGSRVREKKP